MKRKLALLLALVMLFAFFAACNKDSGDNDGTPTGGTPTDGTDNPTDSSAPTSTSPDLGGDVTKMYSLKDLANLDVKPSEDATMRFAFQSTCSSLIPIGGVDDGALLPDALFYETPLVWDSVNNEVIPWLATSWEWQSDTVLRLKLRDDVTSIMGDPYTANDMLFCIDWQCNNPAISTFFGIIDLENCKVIDDYTIDIATKSAYPFLILELSAVAWSQVVEASVDKIGGKEACKDNEGAATGPYKVADWQPNVYINAERRDDYWGVPPYYKYVNVTSVTDANARSMGLEAGDYDLVTEATAMQAETAATSDVMNVWSASVQARCYGLIINSNNEPLNILEVRQAMALAIDYQTIVDIALRGFGDLSDAPLFPVANEMYTPVTDESKNCIRYDLDLAKEKMAAAGYPDGGFAIDCIYRSNDSVLATICELVSNMYSKIGITVNLVTLETATYTTEARSGNYDIAIAIGANPSPKRFLQPIDPRSGFAGVSGFCGDNWFGDFDIEALIDKCSYTVDETERLGYWADLQNFCRENIPKFILCGQWKTVLTNEKIAGMSLSGYGEVYLWSPYEADYIA